MAQPPENASSEQELSAAGSPPGASSGSSMPPSGDRRRHTFSRLPPPPRTSPSRSPSPSQSLSTSPSAAVQQGRRRHVFSNGNNPEPSPTRSGMATGVSGTRPAVAGPATGGSSGGSITQSPLGPSSPPSSSTNETPATGSRGTAAFTSFNPIARQGLGPVHDGRLDSPPESPPESPPLSALTGGSPHSRPGMTNSLIPVDGAMVHPEGEIPDDDNKLAEGCGSGVTNTNQSFQPEVTSMNAAFVEPPVAPVATDEVRENDAFEGSDIDSESSGTPIAADGMYVNRVAEGFDSDSGSPVANSTMHVNKASNGAYSVPAASANVLVSPLPDSPDKGVLGGNFRPVVASGAQRQGVEGDSEASLHADSAALTTSPLFSNPLFADVGGVPSEGCFAKIPNDEAGDVILGNILSCLLDADFPHSVWSGCFTPGKASQLLARSTSTTPGHPPAPLSHFPLDGRPNSATRALLEASTVCRRWRRVIGSHVIKHAAFFSSGQPPPPQVHHSEHHSLPSQLKLDGQSLGMASADLTTGDFESSGSFRHHPWSTMHDTVGAGDPSGEEPEQVVRWPVWFSAQSLVCVLQGGAIPFDLGTPEAGSLQSLCVLKHPYTPPAATSTTLHAYDTACLNRLASLSCLTLPSPSVVSPDSSNVLTAFQNIRSLDISNPIGAPAPQPRRGQATTPAASAMDVSEIPASMHGSLKSLVATLPAAAAPSSALAQLTALRLCGALESQQRGVVSQLSMLTGLQSLAISSPVAWATKAPGALQQHEAVDSMRLAPGALTVLQCMPCLQALSLAGCACVDNAALELVALVTTLTSLDISVCRRVTDNGATQLTALCMLRALDVSWCNRLGSHAAAAISLLPELESLDMSGCMEVDDVGAFAVSSAKRLTALSFKGCTKLTTGALQRFMALSALQSISVSSDTDTGAGLASWGQGGTMHVTQLTLRGFKLLEKDGLHCMARMHELREVSIDCCPGVDGAEVRYLSGLQHLKKVVLRFCPKVDDQALMHLMHATALEVLSLQGSTGFYGNGLRHLSSLSRLHTLDLQQCTKVDASALAFLAALPRLLTVNIAKCPRIQGSDFAHLHSLQSHPHLVIVGLEGRSSEVATECGFRVVASSAAFM